MKRIVRLNERDLTRIVRRVIKESQPINEIRFFSKKYSDEDDELCNSIYRHLEKWDSKYFKDDSTIAPGEIDYTAKRDGDKIQLLKVFTMGRNVYVNGKKLNCSKETFNKLVELFKRKFSEQDSNDRSDIFDKFSE